MKEQFKKELKALTGLIGVSGSEHQVISYCRERLKDIANSIQVLPCGDLIAEFKGNRPGPKMMFAAHADEIGFHIRSISRDGFIYFGTYGGVQPKTVLASRVLFNGSKGIVKGIIGLIPGHIVPVEDRGKLPAMDDMYIDVGASSDKEVYEMGLEIGTTAVVESPMTELNNPDLVTGRCLDDRAGIAALLRLAQGISDGEINHAGTVYITITVQEETGLLGAIHASEAVKPDCFIAVDTAPCGGTPDVPERLLPTRMGGGPIITISDNTSPVSKIFPNRGLLSFIKNYAAANGIPLQRVPAPGAGNNDAGAVNYVGSHCPAIAVVIPRRYSHSASELMDLNDLVYEYRILEGLAANNGNISFDFFS